MFSILKMSSLQTNGEEGSCGTVGRFGDVGCDGPVAPPCFLGQLATCMGTGTPNKRRPFSSRTSPETSLVFHFSLVGFEMSNIFLLRYLC